MRRKYKVTNLFTGQVDHVFADSVEGAMITFLCDHFLREGELAFVRERIRMHGLSSVGHICGRKNNHFIYKDFYGVHEWEFVRED